MQHSKLMTKQNTTGTDSAMQEIFYSGETYVCGESVGSLIKQAMRFGRYLDANQFVRHDKGEGVVCLFSLDGRFVTFPVG